MLGTQATVGNNFQVSVTPGQSPIPQIQGDYANLEKGYSGAIGSQATVPQLTAKYNDQFGVPQLQGQVQGLQAEGDKVQGMIDNAGKTVGQASQQSILTQGQRDAAVQNLTTPLQQRLGVVNTNLSRAQTNLGTAQTNSGQMVGAEQAQQTKQLLPFTQAFSDENVISAMQNSNFTTGEANELSVLLANQSAGLTWTNDQAQRAHELSMKEQDFENSLKLQHDSQSYTTGHTFTPVSTGTMGFLNGSGQMTSGSAWS